MVGLLIGVAVIGCVTLAVIWNDETFDEVDVMYDVLKNEKATHHQK